MPRRCDRTSARLTPQPSPAPTDAPATSVRDLPRSEPFVPFSIAEGELKYVRFRDGQLVLVNPYSCLSHEAAAWRARRRSVEDECPPLEGVDAVLSAGRVHVDRAGRSVRMGERDSVSLCCSSLEGDQDAEFISRVLFGSRP